MALKTTLWRRANDPLFFPTASSLTQHLVVESLMLPVAPQTTSYKPDLSRRKDTWRWKGATILTPSCEKSGFVSTSAAPSWTKTCHTEDEERAAQLETEFLPPLSLSLSALLPSAQHSQFACCIRSHWFWVWLVWFWFGWFYFFPVVFFFLLDCSERKR